MLINVRARIYSTCRTFLRISTESVTHGPRFLSHSVFYTQPVMLSPPFIPESVFYTQSMFYTQSVVRSP